MEAPENQNQIQEMQLLEQSLQNLLMQKQTFQIELSETTSALKEVADSKGDVFKIVGQLMIKSDSTKLKEELENKEKLLSLRMQTIEKQETSLTSKLEGLRAELMKSMKK